MSSIFALVVFVVAAIISAFPIAKEAHPPPPAIYTHTLPTGHGLPVTILKEARNLPPIALTHTLPMGHGPAVPAATPVMPTSFVKVHAVIVTHAVSSSTTSHGPTWENVGFGGSPGIHGPTPITKRGGDLEPIIPCPDDVHGRPQHSYVNPGFGIGGHPILPHFNPGIGVNGPHAPVPHHDDEHGHGDPMAPYFNPGSAVTGHMPHITPRPVPVIRTEPPMTMHSGRGV
ncbi:MAG: hypothetical protein LQ343_003529 [Gyalolechia ehrenbergii]|nr:MAG: hypothetical protein LQ343_003529 [Gyalolechia ehrenbergii]